MLVPWLGHKNAVMKGKWKIWHVRIGALRSTIVQRLNGWPVRQSETDTHPEIQLFFQNDLFLAQICPVGPIITAHDTAYTHSNALCEWTSWNKQSSSLEEWAIPRHRIPQGNILQSPLPQQPNKLWRYPDRQQVTQRQHWQGTMPQALLALH